MKGVHSPDYFLFFFRMESPLRMNLWVPCASLPRMASARVGSPMTVCHFAMGTWCNEGVTAEIDQFQHVHGPLLDKNDRYQL